MITRRLIQVLVVVVVGMSCVFLLPHALKSGPSGIAMQLPRYIGGWIGDDEPVTARELEVLAKDTQFARKFYFDLQGNQILVSIVLSGDDMTMSIHRPERCLPAQGWNVMASERRVVPLRDGGSVETTKLRNMRADDVTQRSPMNLTYYWFVGYDDMTASHLVRTGIDLRDRILHGVNQRWAYVTITTNFNRNQPNEKEAEAKASQLLEQFISELVPTLKRPDGTALIAASKG